MKLIAYSNNLFCISYLFLYLVTINYSKYANASKLFSRQYEYDISSTLHKIDLPPTHTVEEAINYYGKLKALADSNLNIIKQSLNLDQSLLNLFRVSHPNNNNLNLRKAPPKRFAQVKNKTIDAQVKNKTIDIDFLAYSVMKDNNEKKLANTHTLIKGKNTQNFYLNPCIQKGYYDYIEKFKGSGDFKKCKKILWNIQFKNDKDKKENIIEDDVEVYEKSTQNIV